MGKSAWTPGVSDCCGVIMCSFTDGRESARRKLDSATLYPIFILAHLAGFLLSVAITLTGFECVLESANSNNRVFLLAYLLESVFLSSGIVRSFCK